MERDQTEKNVEQLFRAATLYVLGEAAMPVLRGDDEQIEATVAAIRASRELYEALKSERTTLVSAGVLLERKSAAATKFEKLTGIRWRL